MARGWLQACTTVVLPLLVALCAAWLAAWLAGDLAGWRLQGRGNGIVLSTFQLVNIFLITIACEPAAIRLLAAGCWLLAVAELLVGPVQH
jgi:hypothetical protein